MKPRPPSRLRPRANSRLASPVAASCSAPALPAPPPSRPAACTAPWSPKPAPPPPRPPPKARRLPPHAARPALLRNHEGLTGPSTGDPDVAHAQILRTRQRSGLVARRRSLARGVGRAIPTMDRRAFLRRSGLGVGAGLATSQLTLVQEGARPPTRRPAATPQGRGQAHRLRPLLGRLRGRRGGRERRLGAPGAGVRLADQPRRALRQGRRAARARPRRVPPQVRR